MLIQIRALQRTRQVQLEGLKKIAASAATQKVEAAGPPRTFGQAVKPSAE